MTSAEEVVSFTKVVQGQQAHEISRLFAAMLQLVRRHALWPSFGISSMAFKPIILALQFVFRGPHFACFAICCGYPADASLFPSRKLYLAPRYLGHASSFDLTVWAPPYSSEMLMKKSDVKGLVQGASFEYQHCWSDKVSFRTTVTSSTRDAFPGAVVPRSFPQTLSTSPQTDIVTQQIRRCDQQSRPQP
jgi:hypothetical protein